MPHDESATETLKVGDPAPDFTLPTHNEGDHNLAWYRGRKNVLLAFYPADWTPVCATQIPGYVPMLRRFEDLETQVLGISVDSVPCHRAWAQSLGGIPFPLMSDSWPHGEVAKKYGVLNSKGFAERAVFVIDKQGIIRYIQKVHPARIPDTEPIFETLEQLRRQPGRDGGDAWMKS